MRKRKPHFDDVRCPSGSLEQKLDMCEGGSMRGDELLRERTDHPNFNVDMSEDSREGDEMSGDEHSSGHQGDDPGFPGLLEPEDSDDSSRLEPGRRRRGEAA
jgi:hypothetical protein